SAQIVSLVAYEVRGKCIERSLDILTYSNKKGAVFFKKCLNSAIDNAENNNGLDIYTLKVSTIYDDEGITLKRILPRAKGRADRI
ncbi:50S ribosomal protein L22, partial [Psychrobacter proteolyticus]|uniref:50S ribosomal protein L22 n=1 Tax=Psychrobacter proteolyticus TaxID=147825 RepID=UPI00311FD3AB